MEKQDVYVFPAVFSQEPDEEISVVFPDLDVATCGADSVEALASARELLGCALFGLEEDGAQLPDPSDPFGLELAAGELVVLVDVYMPTVRLAQQNRSVNRSVTLPAWLNALAVQRGVNFSQTLQAALREQLQV